MTGSFRLGARRRSPWTFRAITTLVVFLALLLVTSISIAGIDWTPNGVAICTALNNQIFPDIAPDGAGGAIIAWADERNYGTSGWDIYAQRVDADGAIHPGWTADGIPICTAAGDQGEADGPKIVSDGAGGAIIVWEDGRTPSASDIYAQRIDGDGSIHAGWAGNGNPICTSNYAYYPQLVSDGVQGAIVTWDDDRDHHVTLHDIYAQRIDGDGSIHAGWAGNGVAVCQDSSQSLWPNIATDGSSGAIIVWEDERGTYYHIYAQRILSNGTVDPAWTPDGNDVCPAVAGHMYKPEITSDGAGGGVITWQDDRFWNKDVYAQRIDSNGSIHTGWDPNAVAVYSLGNAGDPMITTDGANGAIVTWDDGSDLYVQRVDSSGATQWTANGVDICDAWWAQEPFITSDGSGGAFVAWEDKRSQTQWEIYAQRVNANGAAQWTANGTAICTAGESSWPTVASDGSGGAIITWQDMRTGACDVYAQKGIDDTEPTLTSITPNSGTNDGTVNITDLKGTNFRAGATVKLEKAGQPDIAGANVNVVSGTKITCNFDLDGAQTGAWTVQMENDDGKGDALVGAFTVTESPPPTVTSITPNTGNNAETVYVTDLKGTNFKEGASVELEGSYNPSAPGENDAGGAYGVDDFPIFIDGYNVDVVSPTKITCAFDLYNEPPGVYDLKVRNPDGKFGVKNDAFTITEATPSTWYLAEGTTAWGFDCYISIENPNPQAVNVDITYMTGTGPVDGGTHLLPGTTQTTVNPREILGDQDFSTKVECAEGDTIAVDRTMSWTGEGAPSPDGHCSIGVTAPADTWYLPEGSSNWGFETWLLIQNPNQAEATAQVTYMLEGERPQVFEKKIPANSRKSYNMADDIGAKDASIKVEADIPVIPERAMYRNNRREGHDSIGTTTPAVDYYLAEGTTAWGFTTYVLVQNPNDTATDVTVTYMTSSGPVPQAAFNMDANSRRTIRVNDVLPDSDLSTQVHGSQPIIAERAMYWGENTPLGEACHDSVGMASPHTTFYLPDGQTTDGRETWTLVQNPNDTDVTVEISYLTPDSLGNVVFQETVGANSRKTFSMIDKGISGRAAVMVTCTTPDKMIMVERAMYWNNRGAGTDTIGGFSD